MLLACLVLAEGAIVHEKILLEVVREGVLVSEVILIGVPVQELGVGLQLVLQVVVVVVVVKNLPLKINNNK